MATDEQWPPDYVAEFQKRQQRLLKVRSDPNLLLGAKTFYGQKTAEAANAFIDHWCVTYDPRNAGSTTPATMPFVQFRRQRELIEFLVSCLLAEEHGLVEKCRDMGATWDCAAFSVWLWLFWPGASVGWGSRKEQLVDKIGDPDSIFEKMRMIVRNLPREFLPKDFRPADHATYMKLINPESGATITGEAGDNIGRGGRKLIYFKDESSHYERPELIEAALGDNTRVQIDISSVNGLGNVFHRRREAGVEWTPGHAAHKGVTNVFVMDWRDHPAKTQEWYEARKAKAIADGLYHVFAQEVERNYAASVDGVIIQADWVTASIDAHIKLGLPDGGPWAAALDVADGGNDRNALATRQGIILRGVEEWGERDTGATTRRAIGVVEKLGALDLQYDCIGVGSGVKAEANRLGDERALPRGLRFVPWNAAAEVMNPEGRVVEHDRASPMNKDFYANLKAQAWWQLARRFENTYRAVVEGVTFDPDDLISLPSELPNLRSLQKELSQATISKGAKLKLVVDKAPPGTKSPNMADAVVMAFWPAKAPRMVVSDAALQRSRMPG